MRAGTLIITALCLALQSAGAGTPVRVFANADAFTSTAHPDDNYGSGGVIAVSASGLPKGGFNGVMRFDVSSTKNYLDSIFPDGWNVESVVLTFSAAIAPNAIFNSEAAAGQFTVRWLLDDGWAEGTGTPSAPGQSGITSHSLATLLGGTTEALGAYDYDGGVTGTRDCSFTLPYRFVEDIRNGGLVSIAFTPADSAISMFFRSRTFQTISAQPFITITTGTSTVITAGAMPSAGGSVSGGGVYTTGTPVTMAATPNPGYTFLQWTQDSATASTSASYAFTAGANRTLVASFALIIPKLNLTSPSPGVFTVEWPAALPNWTLQECIDLKAASWADTSRTVSVAGGQKQVTASGIRRFFRLRHTP